MLNNYLISIVVIGSEITNSVPSPKTLLHSMIPLCFSTIAFAIESPRPLPLLLDSGVRESDTVYVRIKTYGKCEIISYGIKRGKIISKRHPLTNQKKTIVSICQGKKEMVKCKVEKYTFFYIIDLV